MYANDGHALGSPVGVVVTAKQLLDTVLGIFKKSIDPVRKQMVDEFATEAMEDPAATIVPGTSQYNALMRLRCLAADPSPAVLQYYRTHTTDTLATQCGCATPACKEYAAIMVREIGRARMGYAPTPPSSNDDGIIPRVTIPVPEDSIRIFGLPIWAAALLTVGGGYMLSQAMSRPRARR